MPASLPEGTATIRKLAPAASQQHERSEFLSGLKPSTVRSHDPDEDDDERDDPEGRDEGCHYQTAGTSLGRLAVAVTGIDIAHA